MSTTVHLDRRTRASKVIETFRAGLVAHAGGKPSAVQSALIERCVQLQLRIYTMDAAFTDRDEQSAHDTRTYLACNNALSRLLRQVGLKGVAERPANLGDYLAARTPKIQGAAE